MIGRGADVDVRIPDPSVALHHATIVKRGEAYLITDEGSKHGTGITAAGRTTPVWLAPDSPRVIEEGERIFVGQIELVAHLEAAPRGAPSGFEELAPNLVRAGLVAAGLEPSDDLVERTLEELTNLPEEALAEDDHETPGSEPLGVADLREDDKNPPWMTDLLIAGIALMILAGCAFGIYSVIGTTS